MRERRRQREIREEQQEKQRKRKKHPWLWAIGIVFLLLVLAAGGYVVYDKVMDSRTMGCRVSVFGQNVSWLTVDEAALKISNAFADTKVEFMENGKAVSNKTLGELGFSVNLEKLTERLTQLKEKQEPCKLFLEEMKNYTLDYEIVTDDTPGKAAAAAVKAEAGGSRTESKDAYIEYDESAGQYKIVPDELGTQIDEERLLKESQKEIQAALQEKLLHKKIMVEITNESYQRAAVTKEQEALVSELNELNGRLQGYLDATVTYTFGDVTEVVDSDTIRSWLMIDGKEISLNEDLMWEHIENLSARYNTMYVPRILETSDGGTVEISNNEYGYWIDEEGEFAQLKADLEGGIPVTREPVYSQKGIGRNGVDDLVNGYVEISLDKQHLWFYKNGELVTETDVVTGKPDGGVNKETGEKESWATYQGAYPLAYKERNAVLSSDIYGYETPVEYWMPFVYGQGLHDADWQPSFGGDRYLTNGSHGCVNLPPSQAAVIFENIEEGCPILIY